MDNWFHKRNKLIQIILLLIPPINYIVEILVRWSAFFRKGGIFRFIICILVTIPTGIIIGHRSCHILAVVFAECREVPLFGRHQAV